MNYGVVVPDVHAARIDVHAESEGTDNRHISTEYLSVLGHVTLQQSLSTTGSDTLSVAVMITGTACLRK